DDQPARRLWYPYSHDEDADAERGSQEEGKPPACIWREQLRIEQHDRARCAKRGTDPKAAVDHKIGPAAIAGRDQFLDGRVDRGEFAAKAGAGEKAEQSEAPDIPRQRGCGGGDEIDGECDEEQSLATEPVGEPAEEYCAEDRAGQVGAGRDPDVGV